MKRYMLHDIAVDEVALVKRPANRRRVLWKQEQTLAAFLEEIAEHLGGLRRAERELEQRLREGLETGGNRLLEVLLLRVARAGELPGESSTILLTLIRDYFERTGDRATARAIGEFHTFRNGLQAETAEARGELAALKSYRNSGKDERMGRQTTTMLDEVAARRDALLRSGLSKDDALRQAALEKMQALAGDLLLKAGPGLTREQALNRVGDYHPELLALYSGDYDVMDEADVAKSLATAKPPRDPEDVYKEIDGLAHELVHKSAGVLTHGQAMDRVIAARPDLYEEYFQAQDREHHETRAQRMGRQL